MSRHHLRQLWISQEDAELLSLALESLQHSARGGGRRAVFLDRLANDAETFQRWLDREFDLDRE